MPLQLRKRFDVDEQPICHDNQTLDPVFQQHGQIAFELLPLVMGIHDEGQKLRRMEIFFNALQDERAEGIGDIEDHHTDGVTAPFTQGTTKGIWTVVHAFGYFPDMFFGFCRYILGNGGFIQNDRNR